MDFALSKTLFDGMTVGSVVQNGQNIFIGDELCYTTSSSTVFCDNEPLDTRKVQRFQALQVSEPGALTLLGLGLPGLGLIRRKHS